MRIRIPRVCKLIAMLMFLLVYQSNAIAIAQSITIKKNQISLSSLFAEIQKQTGLNILYSNQVIDTKKTIDVDFNKTDLNQALKVIGAQNQLEFEIKDNVLLVKQFTQEKSSSFFISIKGVVYAQSGGVLPGASVLVKGTKISTTTNGNGQFELKNVKAGDVLVISYIGYAPQEITVAENKINYIITLKDNESNLETVVVTALGIKRTEKALSYNAQTVAGDEANTVKDPNFVNSLNGKVAGLNINASAGGPGAATRVVIRGNKSIENSNNVLYVIDGIPIINYSKSSLGKNDEVNQGIYAPQPTGSEGISDLNPDDIESMTVLLGPAAAALYGSQAANGAILVTTKKGNIEKAKINISNQTSFSNPLLLPDFQTSYGNTPGVYASWGKKLDQPSTYEPRKFFETGISVQNAVSLSLGNQKNQTYVSGSTVNANGIIPNNKYDRYNFTFRNTTSFLNDKLVLDVGANYILQKNQNMVAHGIYYNPLTAIYTFPRGENIESIQLFEQYNEAREINTQRWIWGDEGLNLQNPYWTAYRNLFNNTRNRYILNGSLKYEIEKWVNVVGRIRLDNSVSDIEKRLYASTINLFANDNGAYSKSKENENQLYGDVIFNIDQSINKDISFKSNIGYSYTENSYDLSGLNGNLGSVPNLFATRNISLADGKTRALENGTNHVNYAVFGNFEFGYKNQLYLTLTGRNEWDSAQANMSKTSYFYPSIGLAAVLSEMFKLPEAISYLKIRGSLASVSSPIPINLSIPHYDYDESTGNWRTNTYMPIGNLLPERTKSYELGLDFRLFKNKLDFKATAYKSNTYNQTITVPISESSGYSSIIAQTGNIENKGLELSLGYKETFNKLTWRSNFSATANRNKIIDLGQYINENGVLTNLDQIQKTQIGSSLILLKTGGTLGDLWTTNVLKHDQNGYIYVDPSTGNLASQDYLQKAGTLNPSWNLGFSNSFAYKGFDLGFLFTARLGGKVISYTQAILDAYGVSNNTAIARDNGGVPINNGIIPAESYYKTIGGTGGIFSNYVYSATNVRLQEAHLSYNLPKKWFKNKLNSTIAVTGRNLWMLYNKAPFDPENIASTGNYLQGLDYFMTPSLRNIGFSVKIEL